jgi:hypothetical protein
MLLSTVSFLHDSVRKGLAQYFVLKQQHSCQHLRFRGLLYDTLVVDRIALGLGGVSGWFWGLEPTQQSPRVAVRSPCSDLRNKIY